MCSDVGRCPLLEAPVDVHHIIEVDNQAFFCELCLEDHHPGRDDCFTLACGHKFCSNGLAQFLELLICEGRVDKLLCPHVDSNVSTCSRCPCEVKEADVAALCGEVTVARLRRFRAMRASPSYRECSRCGLSTTQGSEQQPKIVCENERCRHVFCFVHDDQHPGLTCEAFERSVYRSLEANLRVLEQCSRPCPRCKARVMKTGGCNHMTCRCGASFCWLCNRIISDPDEHYAPWNVAGCPGLHMQVTFGQEGRMLSTRYVIHFCQILMGSIIGMLGVTGCTCLILILPPVLLVAIAIFGVVLIPVLGIVLCAFLLAVVWTVVTVVAAITLLPLKMCRCVQYPGKHLRQCIVLPWRTLSSRFRSMYGCISQRFS